MRTRAVIKWKRGHLGSTLNPDPRSQDLRSKRCWNLGEERTGTVQPSSMCRMALSRSDK